MTNYQLIDPTEPVDFVQSLMSCETGKIPSCFFKKFTGVEEVSAEKVQDANHFLWFLNSLRSLRSSCLKCSTQLVQEFYDQLPAFGHSLHQLEVFGRNKLHLKFDFITKLSRFAYLRIVYKRLSLESMTSLVRSVGEPVRVDLYFRLNGAGSWFTIYKGRDSMVWEVRGEDSKKRFETKKPEELLNFFERLLATTQSAFKEALRQTPQPGYLAFRFVYHYHYQFSMPFTAIYPPFSTDLSQVFLFKPTQVFSFFEFFKFKLSSL